MVIMILAAPPTHAFSSRLTASTAEVDEFGHISNIVYLRWMQEAAREHSADVGWSVDDFRRLGAIFIVRRHEIDYLLPVYAGDAVNVTTWIATYRGASCERQTRFARCSDGQPVARAVSRWVFVSTDGGRPRRISVELAQAFQAASALPHGEGTSSGASEK